MMDPFPTDVCVSDLRASFSEEEEDFTLEVQTRNTDLDDDLSSALNEYLTDLMSTMDESICTQKDDPISADGYSQRRLLASPLTAKCKVSDDSSKMGTPWTPEEETHICELQARYGHDWSKISESIPGRSEGGCRSRWYSHIRSPTKTVQRRKESTTHIKKSMLAIDVICKEQLDPPSNFPLKTTVPFQALTTTVPSRTMTPFVKFSFSKVQPHRHHRSGQGPDLHRCGSFTFRRQCRLHF